MSRDLADLIKEVKEQGFPKIDGTADGENIRLKIYGISREKVGNATGVATDSLYRKIGTGSVNIGYDEKGSVLDISYEPVKKKEKVNPRDSATGSGPRDSYSGRIPGNF